jgi:iron complex outermembrane receptor protein
MDLADLIVRLNLASGFRAPNLAELTSNGVHEGTNRYEIGNSDLKQNKTYNLTLI